MGCCRFKPFWKIFCGNLSLPRKEFCEEHFDLMCQNAGCKNQAVAEYNFDSRRCLYVLCEKCGHNKIHGK